MAPVQGLLFAGVQRDGALTPQIRCAQALVALEKAYNKPVAFSVRTNVMYDGSLDDDSPVHGSAVR